MSVKVCPRHGTVLHQVRDRHLKGGVRLRCRDCKALSDARYRGSEKGRETSRKYMASEKGLKANRERKRRKRAHERNLRRLAMVMRNIAHYERRWGRKVAALIRMAADDRETANENERDLAYQHLRRLGWLE